mmetsp:Transcript_89715/g.187391  ORF Transcript_89715/g.187391 Transcript_89715/m.187391 type:complete len:187 (+) Transcript_89715:95-655(+)
MTQFPTSMASERTTAITAATTTSSASSCSETAKRSGRPRSPPTVTQFWNFSSAPTWSTRSLLRLLSCAYLFCSCCCFLLAAADGGGSDASGQSGFNRSHARASAPAGEDDVLGFWAMPGILRLVMVLGVMYVLYNGSYKTLLFLLALQFSAHLNAGWNGPSVNPTGTPRPSQQEAALKSLRTTELR